MITTIVAMVVIALVVAFSMHMAGEVHDYMTNNNDPGEVTVFEQAFE